ncbi:hypothetical protein BSKO_11870 [Bryopsis sp. KO-2023]|nr:hypothetical protein BSKO_11870 [Bryopsis sp. KO-2023]
MLFQHLYRPYSQRFKRYLSLSNRGAACSYTCTAEGSATMLTNTGGYDRMAEVIMEVSYGRASFSWDVTIPDETIELPLDSSRNIFSYHDGPAREFVRDVLKIDNIKEKFFEAMVLSPWPHHNNPGQLAWASGSDEFPAIFILRCSPQLYYLIHETGHRFGLPHSVVYKVEDGTDPPTDPLSPGVIENSYSDRLDIMACCKGSYNLYSRFTLWPFDRVESRGKNMAVTMRLSDDKALAFGFRSAPYYQDVKIGRWPRDRAADVVASEDMRHNIQGLSVGYSYRYNKRGNAVWSIRGLLDFNLLFGEWPDSIPSGPNRFPGEPAYDAFAQLKEGYPWFHKEAGQDTGIMVLVERLVDCPQTSQLNTYSYSAKGFYGFRGEFPFQEEAEKHDYTGFSDLKCMDLTIRTGVRNDGPPGALNMEIRFADEVAGGVHLEDHCGFHLQPRLEAVFPDGTSPVAIIWKDNLNQTFAIDESIVKLPPLATLEESSTVGATKCSTGCPTSYSVKVASADGRHARAEITMTTQSFNKYAMDVKYTFYDQGGIRYVKKSEEVDIIKRMGTNPLTPRGVHLFGDENLAPLLASSKKIEVQSLPSIQCSKQWTLTFLMKVDQLDMLVNILSISKLPFAPSASMPLIQMANHTEHCDINIHWNTDKVALDVTKHLDARSEHSLTHVMIVRDGDRLGAWINGEGKWFPGQVWCFPSRDDILFCDHDPTGSGMGWGEDVGLWIGDHTTGLEAGVRYMRMYNYAIPADSWKSERDCAEDCRNVFLLKEGRVQMTTPAPAPGKVDGESPSIQDTYGWLQGPWGPCSKHCGGGERQRTVNCAKTVEGRRKFVNAKFCMEKHRPSTREECNFRACTSHHLIRGSIVDASQGVCGSLPECGIQDDGAVLCRNSAGYVIPTWECGVESLQKFRSASKGIQKGESQEACFNLASQCSSDSPYHWAMSPWSKCSRQCSSGTQTRELLCLSSDGTPVNDSLCNSKPKDFSNYPVSRTCNTRPCGIFTWKVGKWEKCHGEQTGYSLRDVRCIDDNGSPVAQHLCVTKAPPDEELCVVEESSADCRPLNSLPDEEDCSARGECTLDGCHCKKGYHGNYCEILSECEGVLGRSGICCKTGILDDDSNCCSTGALLDREGRCCNSGKLDACGVCDGHGAMTDILGECCTSSTLGQTGVCCKSGLVDECGVCDGDSASCGVSMDIRFFLARPTADPSFFSIDSEAGANLNPEQKEGLKTRLAAALGDIVGLHTSQIVSGDLREASNTTEPKPYAVISFENTATSRRLLQDTASSSAGALDFGVLILPTSAQPLVLETVLSKLASYISSSEAFVPEDSILSENRLEPVLVDVRNPSRIGICGNGICEIGEQEVFAHGVEGESACPEDCPFPIRMCPSPTIGGVGIQKEPCGMNGRCLMASGTCNCFKGYSGDACDACTPGYTKSSNLCQKQYINGTWIGARLPTFAIETGLHKTVLREDSNASRPLALIAGIAAVGVVLICSILLGVILCKKVRRIKPSSRAGSRNQSRGVAHNQQARFGVYTPSGSPSNANILNALHQKNQQAAANSPSKSGDSPSIRVISFPQQRNQLAKAGSANMNIEDAVSKNTFSRLQRLSSVLDESNSKLGRTQSLADDMIGSIERITMPVSPKGWEVKQEPDMNRNAWNVVISDEGNRM